MAPIPIISLQKGHQELSTYFYSLFYSITKIKAWQGTEPLQAYCNNGRLYKTTTKLLEGYYMPIGWEQYLKRTNIPKGFCVPPRSVNFLIFSTQLIPSS